METLRLHDRLGRAILSPVYKAPVVVRSPARNGDALSLEEMEFKNSPCHRSTSSLFDRIAAA